MIKNEMNKARWMTGLTLLMMTASTMARAEVDPVELIRAADRSRGGTEKGLTWTAEVASQEDGDASTRTYLIKAKSSDAVVETLTPAKNKGEVMLFNTTNLWFYKNGLRKPVTLSRRQKLTGQAANGDISATDYAGNYTATIQGEEAVNGEAAYKLHLKSKSSTTTYDQIRYWISRDRKVALKAEFLTLQGEVFKTATFQYGATLNTDKGAIPFISEMKIVDGAFPENFSVIRYKGAAEKSLAQAAFNVNNLTN